MRNIFDQYDQPENRLSHALAVCLHEDPALLRGFLKWIEIEPPTPVSRLMVVEQSLPGEIQEVHDEEAAEQRGLPDIVIHNGETWCLLIESKIAAKLTDGQVQREKHTLGGRFDHVDCLVLTKADVRPPRGTIARRWSDLYMWLGRSGNRGEWPNRLRSYLRAAEARLAHQEYLTEGTLTMFDGFPFSSDNPYTYLEGKRLLRLAMRELRKNGSVRALGVDAKALGRGAISQGESLVWDVLLLKGRPKGAAFTRYPHLTLSVHELRLNVAVTIPNSVVAPVRRRLAALESRDLVALNAKILRRATRILSLRGSIEAYAEQRHFLTRSRPARDARLEFKLESSQPQGLRRVKHQREWVDVFSALLRKKRSNIQFGYQVKLPWGTKGIDSRESLGLIVESWSALKPLLDVVRGHSRR